MTPLTTEEIAEVREWSRDYGDELAAPLQIDQAAMGGDVDRVNARIVGNAVPRLLDEVDRARALLKRIEWIGAIDDDAPRWCQICGGRELHPHLPLSGHRPGCELAALIAGTEGAPDLRDEVARLRKLCALAAAELRGDRPDGTWDDTVYQLEQAASGVRQG